MVILEQPKLCLLALQGRQKYTLFEILKPLFVFHYFLGIKRIAMLSLTGQNNVLSSFFLVPRLNEDPCRDASREIRHYHAWSASFLVLCRSLSSGFLLSEDVFCNSHIFILVCVATKCASFKFATCKL